ncbi:hypothetical protein UCDDA912_g04083 [Diaporthe ampelina]|uniref:2EXR domain-containing protein n=1 Tax=Diaporthe ampelina TaxID=1214573 RepID=A0A0G2FPN2_9PEZI|nr:hypothetical protein UCDDA912_g04083 [Diaporthe ampelina]
MVGFGDLPVEIRSEIWAESLSNADIQGIYFFDPEDFGIKDASEGEGEGDQAESDWEVEREVMVAFPAIMHVCRESREFAKSRLSFREDTAAGVSVPCRPYRPEKDAFFVPHRHFDNFLEAVRMAQDDEYNGKLPEGTKAFCREIAHLAFSSRMLMDEDVGTFAYFVPEMTALRLLSFVFGNTDTVDLSRPLRMADLTTDKAELVPGRPRTRVHVEEMLDNIMNQSALWEISDEAIAPWDEWTGEWLFDMAAKRIERLRGLA